MGYGGGSAKYGQYIDILVAPKPCVRWSTVPPPESKILLTAQNTMVAVQNVHIRIWNILAVYELMFIVRNWVMVFFALTLGLCWPAGVLRRGVAGRLGMRMRGAAGRGSPGLVSSSLSMAIYMVDGPHL